MKTPKFEMDPSGGAPIGESGVVRRFFALLRGLGLLNVFSD